MEMEEAEEREKKAEMEVEGEADRESEGINNAPNWLIKNEDRCRKERQFAALVTIYRAALPYLFGHRRIASGASERSRVMFFWCASSVPPPISRSLASRQRRSTTYSPTYP